MQHKATYRANIMDHYGLQVSILSSLLRITTKRGWVTTGAHEDLEVRTNIQCAVCKVAVLALGGTVGPQPPPRL